VLTVHPNGVGEQNGQVQQNVGFNQAKDKVVWRLVAFLWQIGQQQVAHLHQHILHCDMSANQLDGQFTTCHSLAAKQSLHAVGANLCLEGIPAGRDKEADGISVLASFGGVSVHGLCSAFSELPEMVGGDDGGSVVVLSS